MQDDDDETSDGTSGRNFVQLTRHHIRLEGLREVEVDFTGTTRKTLVLVPPELQCGHPTLCEDGKLLSLWSWIMYRGQGRRIYGTCGEARGGPVCLTVGRAWGWDETAQFS